MKNWQKTRNYRSMKDENGNVLSDAQLHRVLDRVLRKTKIDKPFTLHQLRHTFATRALKAGVPITVVSKWLGRAAKRGLRGLGSVRRAGFGTLLGPEFALRDLQRCQCAARRCRALDLRCEKLRFHQVLYLEAPDAPVGPSLLDARPKGVAS